VTVHVAETAGIHEDVEAELLSGAEAAQHFVVLAAMAQAKVDDLAAVRSPETCSACRTCLYEWMAMLVQQGGRDFDFKRLLVEQVDDGFRGRYRLALISSRAACRSSRRVSIS